MKEFIKYDNLKILIIYGFATFAALEHIEINPYIKLFIY